MCNVLLGTAIGDALGVPFEKKLFNDPLFNNWDGNTFLGSDSHGLKPGQYSDDSQLSIIVAESLLASSGFNPDDLSSRYVDWMVSGCARGWGRTTALAIENLKSGMHWTASGIPGSEGNGSAMRAAPFGIYFRNDLKSLVEICKLDSGITHASPEAEAGSIAIATTAYYAVNNDTENLLNKIVPLLPESKIKHILSGLSALLDVNNITPFQALSIIGTKANVKETVPAALYCFLKFDNYHMAVFNAIRAGHDTDTTAAIVGALFGAKLGMKHMPDNLIKSVEDSDKLIRLDSQLYNRSSDSYFPRTS